jgi:hypothetical protein
MTETEGKFFANAAELVIVIDPDTINEREETIGVAKGCEVTIEFEHVELYGMGSIERQGVSKHTAKVPVTISAAKFDPQLVDGFASAYGVVLDPLDEIVGSPSIDDTTFVPRMNLVGTFTSDDGNFVLELEVEDIYFESLPFAFTENEYVVFELSGVGEKVTITDVTPS